MHTVSNTGITPFLTPYGGEIRIKISSSKLLSVSLAPRKKFSISFMTGSIESGINALSEWLNILDLTKRVSYINFSW